MQETWRWFGPPDPISLDNVIQAGATGVVTALHQLYDGRPWPLADIRQRKAEIEARGLDWSVVESIPVHNSIKTRSGDYRYYIEAWKETLRNLAEAGIHTVCYNFMPVVDWTRTNLEYRLPNDSHALRFDMLEFVAYDLFVLRRRGAGACYSSEQVAAAQQIYSAMGEAQIERLEQNIIAGLPGGEGHYDRESIVSALEQYRDIDSDRMRRHLFEFLREVVPVAEACGSRLCVHPDDPPFSLFGLPRVVSTAADARALLQAVDSPANGLTLCAGSYGARGDNDLIAMVREFGRRIHFVHLRNVVREADGSFFESDHLDGDNDMVGLISALMDEEAQRSAEGYLPAEIPMRPDHGHLLAEDRGKDVNPGYSLNGRMKSLAELRGVMCALRQIRGNGGSTL